MIFSRRPGARFNRGRLPDGQGPAGAAAAIETVQNIVVSGTGFTAPGSGSGLVEAWGSGGAGLTNTQGGGGGAYSRAAVTWVESQAYSYSLGVGGATDGASGTDTTWETSVVVAKAGQGGTAGGAGGSAAACTGDQAYSGGNGGTGTGTQTGGGSAGSAANASGATPGAPDGGGGSTAAASGHSSGGRSSAAGFAAGRNGFLRLTFPRTADTTYPWIHARAQRRLESDNTTLTITIPSGDNGDILLVLVASDATPTITMAGDWTKKVQVDNSTVVTLALFSQVATGSESTTVTLSTSQTASAIVWRIKGGDYAGLEYASATGLTADADPPNITPAGGAGKYMILTAVGWDNFSQVSGFPTGYENTTRVGTVATSGCGLCACTKLVNGASENPGTFTSTAEDWSALTIAIPAA